MTSCNPHLVENSVAMVTFLRRFPSLRFLRVCLPRGLSLSLLLPFLFARVRFEPQFRSAPVPPCHLPLTPYPTPEWRHFHWWEVSGGLTAKNFSFFFIFFFYLFFCENPAGNNDFHGNRWFYFWVVVYCSEIIISNCVVSMETRGNCEKIKFYK